jgi:hypothetical protein
VQLQQVEMDKQEVQVRLVVAVELLVTVEMQQPHLEAQAVLVVAVLGAVWLAVLAATEYFIFSIRMELL